MGVAPYATTTTRVLLVDDNPTTVLFVRTLLEDGGSVKVSYADCLAAALELLSWDSFDVLLLGMTLPDADALTALERLHAKINAVPILVLAGIDDSLLEQRCLQIGAQDFLVRPRTYADGLRCAIRHAIDRKRAEHTLRLAKEAAELAVQAKSQLLADLSREIRTPLQNLLGLADTMDSQSLGPLGNPRYQAFAHDLGNGLRGMLELMADLEDLSHLMAGTVRLCEDRVVVAEWVATCLARLGERPRQAGVTVATVVPEDLPVLWADGGRLRQVLDNLLANAVKFTPPGGQVEVSVRRDEGGGMALAVRDTGIGIARPDLPLVMREFGRVRRGGRRSDEGPGLGLPLCSRLMRLHGGELAVESVEGQGTTATLRLPVERCR